jgi:hypothetical protein
MDQTAMLAREFEQESNRIDQLVWDAMALRAGETALFCGFANNVDWIKRAVEIGVDVTVIASDSTPVLEFNGLAIRVLRGSTSMLPSHDASFDATVAFHYLHEIDPFFHANVVSELGRVGRRLIIVEPAPPSDALGQRIAALYSRAKRELGQFENYHHIEYWRKLLAIVKSNVTPRTFTFTRTPPRDAIRETVALIIATMAAEDTPELYLAELRALAKRPDAQLLPQARYVIVGTAVAERAALSAGTRYREGAIESVRSAHPAAFVAPRLAAGGRPGTPAVPRTYSPPNAEAELPIVEPPVAAPSPKGRPVTDPAQVARNAFGLPPSGAAPQPSSIPSVSADEAAPPFGRTDEAATAAAEFGWEWETPEGS